MKRLYRLSWVVCGGVFPLIASAQTPEPDGGMPSSAVVDTVAPPPPVPPKVEPAAAAAPPKVAAIRVYGKIRPSAVFSSGAVESYSQPNASAPTAAGNPVFSNAPDRARLSFQIVQSRLGFWFGEGFPVRAQIELDFIDFAKASPTVAALPRIRIAKLEWQLNEAFQLHAGQDWDLVQPINPHGINLVGALFQAGNTAFMRQQIKAFFKLDNFEFGGALGLQNNNNGNKDFLVELSLTPTAALRAQYSMAKTVRVGVSALVTSLLFSPKTPDEARTLAGLVGAYGELNPLDNVNLRFEAYWSQNGANLFLLSLAQARAGATGQVPIDVAEAGGFVSAQVGVSGPHFLYAQFGGATVLNPENVAPSYSYPASADPSTAPLFSSAQLVPGNTGMRWNMSARLGYELKPFSNLSFLLEGIWFRSNHRLQAVDNARASSVAQSFGVETGFIFNF
jgi:hypothetical protein